MVEKEDSSFNRNETTRGILRRLDLEILLAIAGGTNTNSLLHKHLRKRNDKNVPKSTISHHTTYLKSLGLISMQKVFNKHEFHVTDIGEYACSIFLGRGQPGEGNVVRGHAFGFICKVLRGPRGFEEMLKKGGWGEFYPRNRVGYTKGLLGCTVVFNPKSVQFFPPEVYADSGDVAFDEAFRLVEKVKNLVQEEYRGLVLGPLTHITSGHYAREGDPLAVEYFKTSGKVGVNLTYRSDRLGIDMSKGVPELETLHKVHSKDDLRKITDFYEVVVRSDFQPGDLRKLSKLDKLDHLDSIADKFHREIEEHFNLLRVWQEEAKARRGGRNVVLTMLDCGERARRLLARIDEQPVLSTTDLLARIPKLPPLSVA